MANHALLNNVEHKDLKIITEKSAAYGSNTMYSLVFPFEFKHVQADYPIFFHKDADNKVSPIALFGFTPKENLFIKDGEWHASYIPLMLEREPFLIGNQTVENNGETTTKPVIHIDLDSPRVSTEQGESIFLPHGGNSEYINRISATLRALHDSRESNELFIKTVAELELLEPFNLDIELTDGSNNRLTGFYTINEEKLATLTGEQLFDLNKSGLLMLIYMVIASHANINSLIQKQNAALKSTD